MDTKLIGALIRLGADVNARNNNGETALMCAAIAAIEKEDETFYSMALLIREGADIFVKDSDDEALFYFYNINSDEPDDMDSLLMVMCNVPRTLSPI